MKPEDDLIKDIVNKICTFYGIGNKELDLIQREQIIRAVKWGFARGVIYANERDCLYEKDDNTVVEQ